MDVVWTVGFETPQGQPKPYFEVDGTGDYVMGFMAAVVPQGWTVTTISYK